MKYVQPCMYGISGFVGQIRRGDSPDGMDPRTSIRIESTLSRRIDV